MVGARGQPLNVVITGGTQGVGLAIARRLARDNRASLVLAGRDAGRGGRAANEIRDMGAACLFFKTDVADPAQCAALMRYAKSAYGPINGLVNAAGTAQRSGLLETSLDQWALHFDTNARGPFLLMQEFVRELLEADLPGSIVNIISMAAHCGGPQVTPYSASKAALANLTRNVANAFASKHIRCNGIMAGWMDTPGDDAIQRQFHDRQDGWQKAVAVDLPMGRLIDPDELAGLAAYLLSNESGVVTGSLIDFDQSVLGA